MLITWRCARGVSSVKAPQFGLVDRRGIKLCAGYATKFNLRHTHTALSCQAATVEALIINGNRVHFERAQIHLLLGIVDSQE